MHLLGSSHQVSRCVSPFRLQRGYAPTRQIPALHLGSRPVRYQAQNGLPGDDATRSYSRRIGEAGYAVLASFGLSEDELPVATAQLAALLHGFVSLELAQTIDWVTDPDAAFQGLIEIFAAGLDSGAGRLTTQKEKRA